MQMKAIVIGLALCALLACRETPAQEREGALMFGSTVTSCGKYLEARARNNPADNYAFVFWFFGYVSAYNIYSKYPQYTAQVDGSTILAYLDKHCRDAPLSTTHDGMLKLIKSNGR